MRIVVTGTSRGLGQSMVDGFVARGHQVHGCARAVDAIARLSQRYPPPHSFGAVDITDNASVVHWARQILDSAGPPDLLVNNAASINTSATLWNVPVDDFDRVIDTNIKGMFHVLRALVPAMIDAGHGLIVNFSSAWGRTVSPEVAPYCASKWAVEGLTQSLAKELPAGLTAVPLNPGIIDTDMLRSCFGSSAASFPDAQTWAERAVPYILQLSAKDNGVPRDVPSA